MNNCKQCGKELPAGKNYCNEECVRKHIEAKKAENSEKFRTCTEVFKEEKQAETIFTDDFRDGAFQRGIIWRRTKLRVIHLARRSGVSEEQILRELRIGGITIQKARELMKDSEELFGK
jgi:hypothetical protein